MLLKWNFVLRLSAIIQDKNLLVIDVIIVIYEVIILAGMS